MHLNSLEYNLEPKPAFNSLGELVGAQNGTYVSITCYESDIDKNHFYFLRVFTGTDQKFTEVRYFDTLREVLLYLHIKWMFTKRAGAKSD